MKRIILIALMLLGANQTMAGEVNVAVAANFTGAAHDIVPLFEKATGFTAKVSFGSTGKLYSQIENGAPFGVFLAADSKRPAKAESEGLAVAGSRFTYATGKLVLWSSQGSLFKDGESYLKHSAFQRIAMANPQTAPYGLAAEQVMQHTGVWQAMQAKLVQGESISQTFQFVATGNARVGFVAYSQIKAWKGDAGSVWDIPQSYYAPIKQQAVLLKKGSDNPAARAFLKFLQSDAARAMISSYGYGVK